MKGSFKFLNFISRFIVPLPQTCNHHSTTWNKLSAFQFPGLRALGVSRPSKLCTCTDRSCHRNVIVCFHLLRSSPHVVRILDRVKLPSFPCPCVPILLEKEEQFISKKSYLVQTPSGWRSRYKIFFESEHVMDLDGIFDPNPPSCLFEDSLDGGRIDLNPSSYEYSMPRDIMFDTLTSLSLTLTFS